LRLNWKGVKIINNRERQKSFSYTGKATFSGKKKPDLLLLLGCMQVRLDGVLQIYFVNMLVM